MINKKINDSKSQFSSLSRINSIFKLKTEDSSDHLNCGKKNLLAYLSAIGAPVDLLFHSALESTNDIYNKIYIEKMLRWEYPTRYLAESEWDSIGVRALRSEATFNFEEFMILAKIELKNNRPVCFYAPKSGVPYFLDLMKKNNSPESEYLKLHCFMITDYCEETKELTFFDVFNAQSINPKSNSSLLQEECSKNEELWFADAYSINYEKKDMDLQYFYNLHRSFILGRNDDLSIYKYMASVLDFEITRKNHIYDVESLNAIAILHGSRLFFLRFLKAIKYSSEIIKNYTIFVEKLSSIQKQINILFSLIYIGKKSNINSILQDIKIDLSIIEYEEIRCMSMITKFLQKNALHP